MRISFVLGLLLLTSLAFAQTKKEALVVGAGGEPEEKSDTIFDGTYSNMMIGLNEGGWKTKSYYNGGHRVSEQVADSLTDYSNRNFNKSDFNKEIDGYIERMKKGDLKKGDQLLVSVMTHGWPKENKDLTHKISTSDGTMTLDKLKALRDIAEKKGVKLGILDLSCYSGNTLKLGTDKTCVISLATDDNLGYPVKSEDLGYFMKPRSNLEEAFLKSRASKGSLSPGQTQISTRAGMKTMEQVRLLQYSMQDSGAYTKSQCALDSNQFKKLLAELKQINQGVAGDDKVSQELQEAIQKYNTHKEMLFKSFEKIDAAGKKTTCITYKNGSQSCIPLNNFEKLWDERLGLLNNEERELYREVRSSDEFLRWKKDQDIYKQEVGDLTSLSRNVAAAEQNAYLALYAKNSKNIISPNPCRDFKL